MAGRKKYADFFAEAEKKMSRESIDRARQKAEKAILNLRLAELRKEAGIKQTDVSGFSQTSVSRLESREDLRVSTLVQYLHALGMQVEIRATRKNGKGDKPVVLLRA
ncbi:MAG: XRE family transcriptional regulator [Leptonema illini]|uniref:XRE family transcriptional regulator n=1 Tax=Leptonema illini TaxID=183 RepID=A0A833GYS7_9LEPT|nr:MAG: XRE family transcriptional regulator [Leptonema illini]